MMLSQVMECITLSLMDCWDMKRKEITLTATMIKRMDNDNFGGEGWMFVLEGMKMPVTVYLLEDGSQTCDATVQNLLNDPSEECIAINGGQPIPEEEWIEGITMIVDQRYCYFVTENCYMPKK